MKCANEECSNEAEGGSNYCEDHQFTLTTTGRVTDDGATSTHEGSSSGTGATGSTDSDSGEDEDTGDPASETMVS